MKKMKIFTLLVGLCYLSDTCFVFCQFPDLLQTIRYGEDYFNEIGYAIVETSDGFVIAGSSEYNSAGETDVNLLKIDGNGNIIWNKTYGGGAMDKASSIRQLNDGGFIVVGTTKSFASGASDVWILRTDSKGDTLWTKHYGGITWDQGNCVQQTFDNGYIITGYTTFPSWQNNLGDQLYLIKTNEYGDTLWTKNYGDEFQNYGNWVQETSDSGYIITGRTYLTDIGNSDVWLVKTDHSGNMLWTKTYGFPSDDNANTVLENPADLGYILIGHSPLYGTYSNVYVIRTDPGGDIIWWDSYGATGADYAYSGHIDRDGNLVISGYTHETGIINSDIFLLKIDIESGDSIWFRNYGRETNEYGYDMILTSDLAYMAVGRVDHLQQAGDDIVLMKMGKYNYGKLTIRNSKIAIIEDLQTTADTIDVNIQTDKLINLSVWIDTVIHSSTGDLIFTLYHNGTEDTLIYRVGGSGENFLGTRLYDASDLSIIKGHPPFSRTYRPYNPLSIFNGMDPNGEWVLNIKDVVGVKSTAENAGTLNSWGLTFYFEGSTGDESRISGIPKGFKLYQNYPNPFNRETQIEFSISEASDVKLNVYDITGQKIATLINRKLPAGFHEIRWDATNYTAGVYLLKLVVSNNYTAKKMVLTQ